MEQELRELIYLDLNKFFILQRFVIKVGTNILTQTNGLLATDFLAELTQAIKELLLHEKEIVLVTSGAVAAGRGELGVSKLAEDLLVKQALAAVGQVSLMREYYQKFVLEQQVKIAQLLLSSADFEYLTARKNTENTLRTLFEKQILPIVNENDVTATDELKYMANDCLAAKVAELIQADGLILLTDVPGVFDRDPDEDNGAQILRELDRQNLPVLAGSPRLGGHGGIKTKLKAMKLSKCPVWVVSGKKKNVLAQIILQGENPGTLVR